MLARRRRRLRPAFPRASPEPVTTKTPRAPRPEPLEKPVRTVGGAGRGTLRALFHGLRAGDLECLLLTVAMAAEENRTPSIDPHEVARILAFLARLAEHDAALPPGGDDARAGKREPPKAG